VSDLGSAPLPEIGAEDHVRGRAQAVVVVEYADFECPYCALLHERLLRAPIRRVFRHFPVRSSHPRAWAASCAAEAAAIQGQFWEMHDSLYADQARIEDPHLWERAGQLGLDVERFDHDRRSEAVVARVRRDFRAGVRCGVVTTPTVFLEGVGLAGDAAVRAIEALI
jgi:protein-disulfide isomerase